MDDLTTPTAARIDPAVGVVLAPEVHDRVVAAPSASAAGRRAG